MPSTSLPNNAFLKVMPAAVIKNLRATACLKVYDHIFNLDCIKLTEIQVIAYNGFHGNEEKNMCSQNELMLHERADYRRF